MTDIPISVLLPAYNCEAFIEDAIKSILSQTWNDFELIIINDGSTDQTENRILTFKDPRIKYHRNEKNSGLIYTLNKAISLSKGNYIARMDADDICLPERLSIQFSFLEQHPEVAVVASTITFINEAAKETGQWDLDRKTIHPSEIKKRMPLENCIAHPSVMIRAAVLKEFQYRPYQQNIEDYDLWLRLLNQGYNIAKIETPLLLYRVHDASITGTALKKKNFFFKHANMKGKFILNELKNGKINIFTFKILGFLLADLIKGIGKYFKRAFTS